MTKRLLDIIVSLLVLVAAAPVLAVAMLLIWRQDGCSPLYRGVRVGRGNRDFRMFKLRSMTIGAEIRGGPSTTRSDGRVTPIGRIIRRWKIDELPQFWNVLRGDMSVVGPRPNTRRGGVERYTAAEMRLLTVRPGITDLSSIVFADEADILEGADDPDAFYDAVIRPWKSRLALLYVAHGGIGTNMRLVWLTVIGMVARPAALRGVDSILAKWDADGELRDVCARNEPPRQSDPPGLAV